MSSAIELYPRRNAGDGAGAQRARRVRVRGGQEPRAGARAAQGHAGGATAIQKLRIVRLGFGTS
jgi:hypothetical protein